MDLYLHRFSESATTTSGSEMGACEHAVRLGEELQVGSDMVKVDLRGQEPGWIVRVGNIFRYIVPVDDKFIVVNPFAMPDTSVVTDSYDAALDIIVNS